MSTTEVTSHRTPLYSCHLEAGAKMVDFAGWQMPIQYPPGILKEHEAVRTSAGLFDLSHMGETYVRGGGALQFLQSLFTNDLTKIEVGKAQYGCMCNDQGKVLDDMIIYRLEDQYLVVMNASNREKIVAWMNQHRPAGVEIEDQSMETALIAVQGPRSQAILQTLVETDLDSIPYYGFRVMPWGILSRTGYTGEDGFELFCPPSEAPRIWDALLSAGGDFGVLPCGLGARDTLRLEACLSLYGNDIDQTTTPYEAGLGWVVKLDHDFIGRPALEAKKAAGLSRKLVAFVMEGRGTARHGYPIFAAEQGGEALGIVTSGSLGPTVGKNVGLGYVPLAHSEPGSRIFVDCRGKRIAAQLVKPPFYRRSAS